MNYVDIHNHILFGVDDGAETEEETIKLIDAAYDDGIRSMCCTPHFHPGYFADNINQTGKAFDFAKEYVGDKYPDFELYLGNELRYDRNCISWLKDGWCRTINDSRYLLVDFLENEKAELIVEALFRILNVGYVPILAHAERYENFHRDFREIYQLQECGVVIQVDAQSLFGGWGIGSKIRSKKMIKHFLADVVASDAHNLSDRPPLLSNSYDYIVEKCGVGYAELLLLDNPMNILKNETIRKDTE